jgi:two-component system response regulator BaeR
MTQHVLVVEDEAKIASLLRDYLEKSGYRASLIDRGDGVIPFIRNSHVDIILLDVMLPGMDGMDVCREIRKFSQVPVIMLTARVEEIDRLLGLELGADDYICKPFSPREVLARIRAVLRRVNPVVEGRTIRAGAIVMHEETREVSINGFALKLTPIEFGLLRIMLSHPGRVFSRSELVSRVQGYDYEGYDRTVDTHIKNLRRKMAEFLPGQDVICSVYGVGYRLQVP